MEDDPNIIQVARVMFKSFGMQAALLMEERADDHLRTGDVESGDFWWRVAEAIRELEENGQIVLH
jgi:hypothetical protein